MGSTVRILKLKENVWVHATYTENTVKLILQR